MTKILMLSLLGVGLVLLVVVPLISTCNASNGSLADSQFTVLADDYFDSYYLPTFPTEATALGIHQYDNMLEDYSKAALETHIATLRAFEKRVVAINEENLSLPVKGDRALVLNNIRGQLLTLEKIRPWENNPDIYASGITYSAFVLISRQFAPDAERLKLLVAREKAMPAVLLAAKENLRNPPKIYTEIALEQLGGIINFFEQDVPNAFKQVNDVALQREFAASNAAVIAALKAYQTWMTDELLPQSRGDFRIGEKNFRDKLQYDEMVDTPLDKLLALNAENMRENQNDLKRIAKSLDPAKSVQQVLADMSQDHPARDKVLASFAATFSGLIKFINDKNIITIPSDVRPILQESPPFLRAMTLASIFTLGPFEHVAKEAYFNVTLPDLQWDNKKTHEFMRQLNYPTINAISIHETYPGHYVQFLWVNQVKSRVRKMLGASTNAEGWAHYCEQMILDEGYDQVGQGAKNERESKLLRMGQLYEAVLRNARFVVGIKMHTGEMTYEQALNFFMQEAYLPEPGAILETKRGTMDPTYLYYTLGKLQILALRKELEAKQGAQFNLRQFHDDFMRQGYPPIKIVREALLSDIKPSVEKT